MKKCFDISCHILSKFKFINFFTYSTDNVLVYVTVKRIPCLNMSLCFVPINSFVTVSHYIILT